MNGIQEVSGSIPLISTKIKDSCSRREHGSLIVIAEEMGGYLILNCRAFESGKGCQKKRSRKIFGQKTERFQGFGGPWITKIQGPRNLDV